MKQTKSLIVALIALVVLISALAMAFQISRQNQDTRSRASGTFPACGSGLQCVRDQAGATGSQACTDNFGDTIYCCDSGQDIVNGVCTSNAPGSTNVADTSQCTYNNQGDIVCPQWDIIPGFCAGGTIVYSGTNVCGCQNPPSCLPHLCWNQVISCPNQTDGSNCWPTSCGNHEPNPTGATCQDAVPTPLTEDEAWQYNLWLSQGSPVYAGCESGGNQCPVSYDHNQDGSINLIDYNLFLNAWLQSLGQ